MALAARTVPGLVPKDLKQANAEVDRLRRMVKYYRQREAAVNACFRQEQFKISREGGEVYFRRISKAQFEEYHATAVAGGCTDSTRPKTACAAGAVGGRSRLADNGRG
ncbi:hypothetical protein KEM52_002576, partial [Ascosphaera acerosa]